MGSDTKTTLEGALKQTSSKDLLEYKDIVVTKYPNTDITLELDIDIYSVYESTVETSKQY